MAVGVAVGVADARPHSAAAVTGPSSKYNLHTPLQQRPRRCARSSPGHTAQKDRELHLREYDVNRGEGTAERRGDYQDSDAHVATGHAATPSSSRPWAPRGRRSPPNCDVNVVPSATTAIKSSTRAVRASSPCDAAMRRARSSDSRSCNRRARVVRARVGPVLGGSFELAQHRPVSLQNSTFRPGL